MGLCTNIENWNMSAAICMATEGIRAKYSDGAGGGGFGAIEREIGSKLDAGKILAAVGQVELAYEHLADWSMFAYASPNWNKKSNASRLYQNILHDWVCELGERGEFIQDKTFKRVEAILPFIAGGLALEQSSGADVIQSGYELKYVPVSSRTELITQLVAFDCKCQSFEPESFKQKRKRYYQNHWSEIQPHIDTIRTILLRYDSLARKLYKKALDSYNGAN